MDGGGPGPGLLRRIRRTADMSQRELALACGVPQAAVAQAESGRRGLPVDLLARAAAVAGLRLALLDAGGHEVAPMADGTVRDQGRRRFPAHQDTRYSEEGWWHGRERYSRPEPWYPFDRDRDVRDAFRRRAGTPADHQVPRPGDAPEDRRAALRLPAGCAELEDWQGPPRHVDGCPCGCDPC